MPGHNSPSVVRYPTDDANVVVANRIDWPGGPGATTSKSSGRTPRWTGSGVGPR